MVYGGDVMARIEKSIVINAPSKKIWEMLFWDRIPEWLDGISATYTSHEKDNVGATAHVSSDVIAGLKAEWDVEISEYTEYEKATWRSTRGNVTALGETTLEPIDTGIKLTFVIDFELPYSLLGKIIDKLLVRKELEQDIETGLKKLKNMLEN
jgi:uncharacterized membrane protein